jgi:iduronate 2-sulfatase
MPEMLPMLLFKNSLRERSDMKVQLALLTAFLCTAFWLGNASLAADRPNILFIAIDDLRCDLGVLGVEHAKTPQLDAFAKTARVFSNHYVQVPTCGASRCALLRGRYPTVAAQVNNGGILQTHAEWGSQSLPAVFRAAGYHTLALGKITHHPGGLTGKGWAEGPEELPGAWEKAWIPDGPWKTPEAIMHGYANGVARRPGKSPPWEAFDGPDEAYPDAWVAAEAVETLRELVTRKDPWFFGVGFFKPHLPFAAPQRWHDLHGAGVPDLKPEAAAKPAWPSGWHGSGEFRGNYGHAPGRDPDSDIDYARLMRRAYAASISYMDAQVGRVLEEVHRLGLDDNTIIVVWSDHGFLLGEHAIWGKHCLYEQALRSPLMIRHSGLPHPGDVSHAIVETVDLFPTLVELCGLQPPPALDGHSLRPQLNAPATPSAKPAHGFWTGGQRTVRTEGWRLIVHPSKGTDAPQVELFDYESDPEETLNHASAHPAVVAELLQRLNRVPSPASTRPAQRNK